MMNEYLTRFMDQFPFEGLTYDDVTLVTQYADFLPDETSLKTRLTSRIEMNIPFISAARGLTVQRRVRVAARSAMQVKQRRQRTMSAGRFSVTLRGR